MGILKSKNQTEKYFLDAYSMQGRRKSQEDNYLIHRGPFGDIIGLVADGVGGYAHGEFASQVVKEVFENTFAQMDKFESIESYIRKTLYVAATMIMQEASQDASYKMSSTTVSGFIITRNDDLYVFNVGDSRVYLLRDGELERLTKDHSVVQELVDAGRITEKQAFYHPDKYRITNSLSSKITDMRIDVENVGKIQSGDLLLASTDGLHDYVWDDEILEFVKGYTGEEPLAKALCQLAYNEQSYDNITVVVCQRLI